MRTSFVKPFDSITIPTQWLKVCKDYSKVLSNSNVPCCNCCGLNSDIKFLAIDHIIGREQMDSEPELVAIGYTSELENQVLLK